MPNGLSDRFADASGHDLLLRAVCGSEVTGVADAGLAIGTTSTAQIRQVNAVDYMSIGIRRAQVAAGEFAFTPGTHNITRPAVGQTNERWFTCYLTAAGARTLAAGQQTTGANTAKKSLQSKDVPFDAVVLGFVLISVANTATNGFVAGTTALSATGITATYVSVKKVIIDETFEP